MSLQVVVLKPDVPHAYGATLGQELIATAEPRIRAASEEDTLLLLDLSEVLSVTPSYLKATLLSAAGPYRSEAQPPSPIANTAVNPKAVNLYAAVTGCSRDVAVDVHEFFQGRGLPILHITKRRAEHLLAAQVLGTLDPLLLKTLAALVEQRSATAAQLAERSDESISINGWNNRLADLHSLRLVARRREGKFWMYSPIVEKITLWA